MPAVGLGGGAGCGVSARRERIGRRCGWAFESCVHSSFQVRARCPERLAVLARLASRAAAPLGLVEASVAAEGDSLELPAYVVGSIFARPLSDAERERGRFSLSSASAAARRASNSSTRLGVSSASSRMSRGAVCGRATSIRRRQARRPPELVDVADLQALQSGSMSWESAVDGLRAGRASPSVAWMPRSARARPRASGIRARRRSAYSAACAGRRYRTADGRAAHKSSPRRRPQRVAHPDLVPDIGIVDRQVGDNELGQQRSWNMSRWISRPAGRRRRDADQGRRLHRRPEQPL